MEAKSIALRNSLKCLDDIEKGVSGDVVDGSQLLASKLNTFVDSLSRILQEGSTMDESTIFKVPMDLLEFMDMEGDTNFDAYMRSKEIERETSVKAVTDRVNYLQKLSENLQKGLDE